MSKPGRLAILGASGHGKVVADIALQSGWEKVCFYDDAYPGLGMVEQWPVAGTFESLLHDLLCFDGVVVAIGDNRVRDERLACLLEHGGHLATLIHPRATVSSFATLAPGCVVVAGAVINAFAMVARGCIINTAATVGHDCRLAHSVHVASGANVAGGASVGRFTWVGVGSAVRQGVRIGEGVTVGAGAAVVSDVADGATVVGVPARPIQRLG